MRQPDINRLARIVEHYEAIDRIFDSLQTSLEKHDSEFITINHNSVSVYLLVSNMRKDAKENREWIERKLKQMTTELKRRDLSGIYIFDTFPGEKKRQPTCIEDCQQETRRKWCMAQTQDSLRETIEHLAKTFKDMTDYLVMEHCVSDEQRTEFFAMIDRNVERSKYNLALHELADQVDFFCEKVTLLADACGVAKHVEDT